jgi:hypothetical protein
VAQALALNRGGFRTEKMTLRHKTTPRVFRSGVINDFQQWNYDNNRPLYARQGASPLGIPKCRKSRKSWHGSIEGNTFGPSLLTYLIIKKSRLIK